MLDKIFEPIFAPFRWLRSTIFGIKQAPARLKGEVMRAKYQVDVIKGDMRSAKADLANAKNLKGQLGSQAAELKAKAQGVKVVGSGAQSGASAVAAGGAPSGYTAPSAKPAKVKMGLFSKKKKCPQCSQKLHASWDECPFCGWGKNAPMAAPMPSAGGKQRTVALNIGGGGGGGGAVGSSSAVADSLIGWFIPLEGKQAGELFQLRGRVTVGTADDNDIVMQEAPSISGHHCEFVAVGGGFKLNDLGSTNGTFVNDKRVNTHDLIDNDNVKLGRMNFKYKSMV